MTAIARVAAPLYSQLFLCVAAVTRRALGRLKAAPSPLSPMSLRCVQDASVLFVELSRFHELAPASEPEAVISLLNDVFCDVRADNSGSRCLSFQHCRE